MFASCTGCGAQIPRGMGECASCILIRRRAPKGRGLLWPLIASGLALLGSLAAAKEFYDTRDLIAPTEPAIVRGTARGTVRVSEQTLFFNEQRLCRLPPLTEQATVGVGAHCKRVGSHPTDLFAEALAVALPADGDLQSRQSVHIFVNRNTPYRVLISVLFTLGQTGYGEGVTIEAKEGPGLGLLSFTSRLPHSSYDASDGREDWTHRPFLSLRQTPAGIHLAYTLDHDDEPKVHVAEGCIEGASITFPNHGADADYAAIASCIRKLQKQHPELLGGASDPPAGSPRAGAEFVTEEGTPALSVLRLLGTLRCGSATCLRSPVEPGDQLFSEVHFLVPPKADYDESDTAQPDPAHRSNHAYVVHHLRPALGRCYAEQLARTPVRSFRLSLRLQTNSYGNVVQATLESSPSTTAVSARDSTPLAFSKCIRAVALAATFPQVYSEPALIIIPLSFVPSAPSDKQ